MGVKWNDQCPIKRVLLFNLLQFLFLFTFLYPVLVLTI
jgi:hypothetical protein